MTLPPNVLELENRSLGRNGEPTLAAAYHQLKVHWDTGNRDREVILHLLFLAWYGLEEPQHITGFENLDIISVELQQTFTTVFRYVQPAINNDVEMLYIIGLMAYLFPYLLTPDINWETISEQYRQRYRVLEPNGIRPEAFRNRGAYGEYFEHQASVKSGY